MKKIDMTQVTVEIVTTKMLKEMGIMPDDEVSTKVEGKNEEEDK